MHPKQLLLIAASLGAILSIAPAAARADEPEKAEPPKPEPKQDEPKKADPAPAKEAPKPAEPASQDPKPADPAPAPTPETPEAQEGSLPSLDEMLGLETQEDADLKKLLEDYDPDKVQLERVLTAQEAAEKLQQAVQQMHETAFRLEEIRDPGLVTQRLQAEILTKLDMLIKNAESQSQSSSSSSSSSSQSQGQQDQQMPQKGSQPQESQQAGSMGDQDHTGGPAFQEGQRDQFEAAKAAWGALPERVRDRLIEGSSDYFSQWYQDLTREYYRRIAEEATK